MIFVEFFLAPTTWQEVLDSLFFETTVRPLIRSSATLPVTAPFYRDFLFSRACGGAANILGSRFFHARCASTDNIVMLLFFFSSSSAAC